MFPTAWARAIHVRLDVRGMLRDLADIADAGGNFEIQLIELMGLSSTAERSTQRMLAYLETIGAITRDSQPGRSGFVRARLCLEVDPSDIQHIVNVAAPALAAATTGKGVKNDTIRRTPEPGNGVIFDTIETTRAYAGTRGVFSPYGGEHGTFGTPSPNGAAVPAAAADQGSNGHITTPRKRKPRPPALKGSPTLTPSEQQQLVADFLPRFAELRLGEAAIARSLGLWAVSDKALRFPRQFPVAQTWLISATDWLEHDLRWWTAHPLVDRSASRSGDRFLSVPAGRSDYGFSEGRALGDPRP